MLTPVTSAFRSVRVPRWALASQVVCPAMVAELVNCRMTGVCPE
jgi:hypothetical protein